MKKEAFQGIAKHFAESISVKLIFEEGATPSTNGEVIVLPTEMSEQYLDETLGALLHETNHIRYSNMKYFEKLIKRDKLLGMVTNFLEDIRVDYKSLKTYPNSKCFYISLIEDVISRASDTLAKEDLEMKKLKALLLDSHGVDIARVYGLDENFADIEECTNDLRKTIFEVYDCPNTESLTPHVVAVIKRIFGEQPEKSQQPQTGAGNPDNQPCNGGQGAGDNCESQPSEADSNSENDSGNENDNSEGSEDQKEETKEEREAREKLQEAIEQYCEALDKKTETEEDKKNLEEEYNNIAEEARKAMRSRKTYNTKARKLENDMYYNGPDKAKQEKVEYYKNKSTEKSTEYGDLCNKANAVVKTLSHVRAEADTANKEYSQAQAIINNSGFGQSDECNLLGFEALDNEKLIDKNYVETPYNPSLDELIKEVLILKQEEYQIEETGKLNTRYLHEIYTDVENLFQEKDQKEIKTRVSVIVDTSGSMGNERGDACMNAVNILATAFKKATDVGAPGEMSIYAFSNDCMPALNSIEQYKQSDFTWENFLRMTRKVSGNGTNLAKCVNQIVNEVEGDPEYRNVLIVITDAEVDDNEVNTMVNNISSSDARIMYIAVQANIYPNTPAHEVFGENNIKGIEDAPAILERVMFTGLQQVN